MISVSNLSIRFSAQTLFEKVSLQFNPGNRYGLVGANGSGKTTFLKILSGDEMGFDGTVNIPREVSVGVLRQDHFSFEEHRVVDVVIGGNYELFEAMQEKERLLNLSSADEKKSGLETGKTVGHGENSKPASEKTTEKNGNSNIASNLKFDASLDADSEVNRKIDHKTIERISELEEKIIANEGYSSQARACRLLDGVGVDSKMHFGVLRKLSGGYKLRVLLARLLFEDPDVLLLDEPTNHLDILSIAWLENYLVRQYKGLVILISHDRHFINQVCNYISDVDFQTITLYKGTYTKYIEARDLAVQQKLTEIKALEKKSEELQQFVDRFRAKASKAKQAQSRAKQLEKIDLPEIVRSSRRYPALSFDEVRPSGREVLSVKSVEKSFGDNHVLHNISFTLERGERVGLIGPNGMGKTTLLKIITGNLAADKGTVQWGYETHTAYFAQDHRELLVDSNTKNKAKRITTLDWMGQNCKDNRPENLRKILARALFTEDDCDKSIESLSGGERGRLVLASIMEKKPNVLILDEPTNHLDLESIEALEGALSEFKGTTIFVSHDKNFVSSVAKKIFEIRPEGLEIHDGSYADYLEKLGSDYLQRDINSKSKNTTSSTTEANSKLQPTPVSKFEQSTAAGKKPVSDHQTQYQDKKERKKYLKKLINDDKKLEEEITAEESQIEKIETMFSCSDFYTKNTPAQIQDLQDQRTKRETHLTSLMERWEQTQSEISDLRVELKE